MSKKKRVRPGAKSGYVCMYCGKEFNTGREVLGHAVGKHIDSPRLRQSTIIVDKLSLQQRGYLAAFLDGEGGIQITKSFRRGRRRRLSLHTLIYFTNSTLQVIQTIKTWLSAGVIIVARQREGYRRQYVFHITGVRNIRRLLRSILPFLIVKRKQAELMLEFCRSRERPKIGQGTEFTQHEIRLYRSLESLNLKHRGKLRANSRIAYKSRKS